MDAANAVGTCLGVVLGVGAFALAYWQLRRTTSALESANAAVGRTERQLAFQQLLMHLPQLQAIEQDLDRAVAVGERGAAATLLIRWRQLAAETRGLLGRSSVEAHAMDAALTASILASATATAALVNPRRPTVRSSTEDARAAVTIAATLASELIGQLRAYSGGDHE